MPDQQQQPSCVIYQQADREYRKAEGTSQSEVKTILESPQHHQLRYGPNAKPFFPSGPMIMGSAIHALILEPEEFPKLYFDRAEKPKDLTVPEMKAEAEAQQLEIPKGAKKADLEALLWPEGKPKDKRTSLAHDDFEAAHQAAASLRAHEIAGPWFDPKQPRYRRFNEVSLYARHELGMMIKGRLDRMAVNEEEKTISILDLKTTDCATYDSFSRKAFGLSYDLQAFYYSDLVRRCLPGYAVEFLFIVLERKAPFGVNIFSCSDQLLLNGARKMERGLKLLASCKELEYWPGYEPVIQSLRPPAWALEDDPGATSDF